MARGRASLQQGLDKDVYQIVRKYLDTSDESPLRLKAHQIYDYIKNSNSSLKRRPKKQLEDSIERVLMVFQEEESVEEEMDNLEGDFTNNLEDGRKEDSNMDYMNRQIVSKWRHSGTATPVANGEKSRKREGGKGSEREVKRQKRSENKIDVAPPQNLTLRDIGGVDHVMRQLKSQLVLPLLQPEEYVSRKLAIPRGILLHGPPGCGKTVLSRAFAAHLGIPFIEILGPSIVSGMSGESEKQVREHFEKAKEVAPSLIFIDEIDVIAPKRDSAQSQMEKRIVAQLLISMDSLAIENSGGKPVIVLAATNRPDSLDPALRRGGRFDSEINIGVPNETVRKEILGALTREIGLSPDVDFSVLARRTAGFVGADLKDLVSKAGTWSMNQYREALEKQASEIEVGDMDVDPPLLGNGTTEVDSIDRLIKRLRNKDMERPPGFEERLLTMKDFDAVLPTIVPSSKREGFATVPDTTWEDVGALSGIRETLEKVVVGPIKNPGIYEGVGLRTSPGVLLWGPPGCGKTLLAKAVAAESKANFISIKGPELLSKYVGDSERALRQVFMRARSSVPCIIFFDEIDSLVPKRSSDLHEASARMVNTLLTELDGLDTRDGITLIAATNRPDMIDAALLRPGRLGRLLYVELPGPEERVEILRALIRQRRGAIDERLAEIGRRSECDRFSGADLNMLLDQAAFGVLKRRGHGPIEEIDMLTAAQGQSPSVRDIEKYEEIRERFKILV